ncbi:MAG TPA: FAD:protein FMN transferase [Steroidobacteraceae bacterium]
MSLLALGACERAPEPQYLVGPTMGTTYHVTVTALPDPVTRGQVQGVIDEVLAGVDEHLSTWRADSEISRFNASSSVDWMPVTHDLYAVLEEAQRVSRESSGAFDVTVGPLVDLWGFGRGATEASAVPTAEELRRVRADVGFDLLEVRKAPPAIRKRGPGVRADVAGIAPGYAVDLIAERLRGLQVAGALVEIGGEVRAWGRNPSGERWRVAVEAPVAGERRAYALVELDDMSVSTSGDYRDFRIVGGRRISHTIDPRTATPVPANLASVTVLHASAMTADAYATALMVMGPEAGLRFAEQHGLAALFLERVPGATGWHERVTPEFTRLRRPLP